MANYRTLRRHDGTLVPPAEGYQIVLRERFDALEKFLRGQVDARQKHRQELTRLRESRFEPEYLEEQIANAAARFREANAAALPKALELVGALVETISERHQDPLDLTDPRLSTALTTISTIGPRMDHADLARLVDQFVGDPAALRALLAGFESVGLTTAIGLVTSKLYHPADVKHRLSSVVQEVFRGDGASLNFLASEVGKVAAKEGLPFPKDGQALIDPEGAVMAVRMATGLPAES